MSDQSLSQYVTLSQLNELAVLRISNREASAKLALQGAHLIEFARQQQPNCLFVSSQERYQHGKAIRGGIPVCWPWFGKHADNPAAPAHGFARTAEWQYEIVADTAERTDIKLWLDTDGNDANFPFRAHVELLVSIGQTLILSLSTINRDDKAFLISQALHSYYPCQAIDQVRIHGLHGAFYNDSRSGTNAYFPSNFQFDREIDWIVLEPGKPVGFSGLGQASMKLTRIGSRSLVVWNPWIEKSQQLSQFHPEEYRRMFCVETANVSEDSRLIKPGKSHVMMMELTLDDTVVQ